MNPAAATQLTELLDQQLAALESVLNVLAREQTALEARDVAALESLTAEKQEHLAAAAGLEQQRRELAPSPAAMETLAESPAIAERWARLLELTRACRDHNEANGRIIRRQQRRVESTLTLMRGQGEQTDVYGPDGADPAVRTWRLPMTSV